MKPENLLLLQHPTQKCTLGCPILDRLLAGGVPCNSITELVSESGCGKTQLCLQLLLSAQLPVSDGGLAAASLYIHSEFPFPFRRLHQLSHPRLSPSHSHNPRDHIFIRAVQSAEELLAVLDRLDALLADPPSKLPVKLIVIDSIAVLFRSEFDNTPAELKKRSCLFFRIAGRLKFLAKKFGAAVVVTNQVVDLVEDGGVNGLRIGNLGVLCSSGRRVCAALGLSWANCVNSRLFLSRNEEIVGEKEDSNYGLRTRRRMHVVFAPHLPESSCEFVIVREGVFGVDS